MFAIVDFDWIPVFGCHVEFLRFEVLVFFCFVFVFRFVLKKEIDRNDD